MAKIKIAESGFYRIPLTVALSDSTHGEIKAFELLTCEPPVKGCVKMGSPQPAFNLKVGKGALPYQDVM